MTAADVAHNLAVAELDARAWAGALERVASEASGEAEAYRYLLVAALAELHDAGQRERALRRQLRGVRDELRRYTARQTIGRAA